MTALPDMHAKKASKTERMQVRLTSDAKRTLEHAASMSGRSVSDFVVASALDAAHEAIEKTELLRLTVDDRTVFLAALENPPEPNKALKAAAEEYVRLNR